MSIFLSDKDIVQMLLIVFVLDSVFGLDGLTVREFDCEQSGSVMQHFQYEPHVTVIIDKDCLPMTQVSAIHFDNIFWYLHWTPSRQSRKVVIYLQFLWVVVWNSDITTIPALTGLINGSSCDWLGDKDIYILSIWSRHGYWKFLQTHFAITWNNLSMFALLRCVDSIMATQHQIQDNNIPACVDKETKGNRQVRYLCTWKSMWLIFRVGISDKKLKSTDHYRTEL